MTLREKLKAAAATAEGKRRRGEFPPLHTQALTFGKAVGRAATAIVTCAEVLSPPEERERRQAICDQCERYVPRSRRCKECGCRLAAKLRMATENCPIGKWNLDS